MYGTGILFRRLLRTLENKATESKVSSSKLIKSNAASSYPASEKIFIAAMFYNNEYVIPYWHDTLIKVIHYLGPDNVFVSIVESHSTDESPQLLDALDADLALLGVSRRILTRDKAVPKPDDMRGNNRIEFLAATRNRVIEPLIVGGYDRVVFSNDIFIEPESFVELLETNSGDYDMACGLDMGHFGSVTSDCYGTPVILIVEKVHMICGFFEIDRQN